MTRSGSEPEVEAAQDALDLLTDKHTNPSISFAAIARSAAVLVGGSGTAQVINFVGAIAIARLFIPAEFGLYAIFISLHTLGCVLATMRYELAIVIEEQDTKVSAIAGLVNCITIAVSFAALLMAFLARYFAGDFELITQMSPYLWFLPISLFFAGQYQLFIQWCIRLHDFRQVALGGIGVAAGTLAIQLGLGFAGWGARGLVIGFIIGQITGLLIVMQPIRKDLGSAASAAWLFDFGGMIAAARKHYRFPAFQVANSFFSAAYINLPALILGGAISPHAAGAFSMAFRLTFQSLALIPTAIGQVVFVRLARTLDDLARWETPIAVLYLLLGLLLAAPSGVLLANGQSLAVTILGPEWADAGLLMQVLALPCLLMALAAGYDRIYDVLGRQFLAFLLSAISSLIVLISLYVSAIVSQELLYATVTFALIHAIYSLVWTLGAIRASRFSCFSAIQRWAAVSAATLASAGLTHVIDLYVTNAIIAAFLAGLIYLAIFAGGIVVVRNTPWGRVHLVVKSAQ